jgi:hypothetical protein
MMARQADGAFRKALLTVAAALGASSWTNTAQAYDMWLRIVVGPKHDCVHEQVLLAAQACTDKGICERADRACDDPNWGGLRDGVRWNDDPLRLTSYGSTYLRAGAYFTHGSRVSVKYPARIGVSWNTHYRSHYGDMQFLHGMASSSSEAPEETQRRILLWAEFVYRAAIGDLALTTPLKDVSIPGIPALFEGKQWTIRELLTMRCIRRNYCPAPDIDIATDLRVRQTAMGSLLHVVQDSFSASHTERAGAAGPSENRVGCFGSIRKFFHYPSQDPNIHARSDQAQHWMSQAVSRDCMNPVTASARVLELGGYGTVKTPQPWSVARNYLLDSVFILEK